MPMFEFKCEACGEEFEELLFSSSAKASCPKCGSENTKKQFSAFSSNAVKGGSSGGGSTSNHGFG